MKINRCFIRKKMCASTIVYCLLSVVYCSGVFATTRTWFSTTAGGSWATPANWGGTVPTTGDDVVINNNGTGFAITAVPAISLNSLTIGGTGTGSVTLTAATSGNLITITSPGTWTVTNSLITSGLNLTLNTGTSASVAASKSFQFDKTITNNSTLTVSGTLVLSTTTAAVGTNAVTWVSGATLQYGNADATTLTTTVKEWPASAGPDNVIIKTTGTITLNGAKALVGSLTITSGTLADGGFALTGNSTSGNSFTIANGAGYTTTRITTPWLPTYSAPATISFGTSSTISYNGTGSFILPAPPATYGNLVIGSTGTKTVNDAPLTTAGNLTLANNSSAILLLNFGLSIGGTITGGNSTTLDVEDGGSAPAITLPAITNGLGKLIINRAAGITLGSPLTLAGISGGGALTLTNGNLTTTSSNLLTISYAFTSAINGGSSTSFVNGPMVLTLSASYSSGGTFSFPFGDPSGPYYTPLQLVGPVTNSGTAATISAQVFNTNAGGTAGTIVSSLNTNRYWSASFLANSGSIVTIGNIKVTDPAVTLTNGTSEICYSTTLTGIYNALASTVAGSSVTSNNNTTNGLGFFVIGAINNSYNFNGATVGTGQPFQSLTNPGGLFDEINAVGTLSVNTGITITSDLTVATEGGTGETGDVWLNAFAGGATLTFQPSAASQRVVSGTGVVGTGQPMISINGAAHVTIDGSFSGSGQYLLFRNSNATPANVGPTIQITNGATSCTIKNCLVQNNASTKGPVTVITGANTGILITGNNISGSTADNIGMSANGVFCSGTSNVVTVSANNIFNFAQNGIDFSGSGSNSQITGNSIYQTASFAAGTNAMTGILLALSGSPTTGISVQGNFIGGNASALTSSAITGTWTCSSSANTFFGISSATQAATNTTVTITGNTIAGISFTTSATASTTPGVFVGILTTIGPHIVGASGAGNGNTIGSTANPITIICSASAGTPYAAGIDATSSIATAPAIVNNSLSAITFISSNAATGFVFNGIRTGGSSPFTVVNNTIGGSALNSISIGTAAAPITSGTATINGILAANTGAVTIQTNTVQNITGNSTTIVTYSGIDITASTGAVLIGGSPPATYGNTITALTANGNITTTNNANHLWGIYSSGSSGNSSFTIQGNAISNLKSTGGNVGGSVTGNLFTGIIGINATSNVAGQLIDQNTITGLQCTSTSIQTSIIGIAFGYTSASAAAQATITRNQIYNFTHHFTGSTGSTYAFIIGIDLAEYYSTTAATVVANNMISFAPTGTNQYVSGIFEEPFQAGVLANYYFNSVYIGGANLSTSTWPSFAFARGYLNSAHVSTSNIKNNIFVNERTGGTSTTFHYCIYNSGGTIGLGSGASDYNILGSNNSDAAHIGRWATNDETFANWKNAGGSNYADVHSYSGIPVAFTNTGTGDLHIGTDISLTYPGTPLATSGTIPLGIDFDAQNRDAVHPEIGADEFVPTCTAPTLNPIVTNVSCNGGSNGAITLSTTGGTSPFTYAWSNGATASSINNLTTGNYSVTVTASGGCTVSSGAINASQPTVLSVSSVQTSTISCHGGSATVMIAATGGTPPYGGTGTFTASAGSYTFVVTDSKGCTAATSIVITEPSAVSASSVINGAIACHGGSTTVTISASGGTPGYAGTGTYTVNAGAYSFTVTDANSCTAVASGIITEPSAISASASSNTPVCAADSIDLTSGVSGGTGNYQYLWSGPSAFSATKGNPNRYAATTTYGGTYSLTVTDANNCGATATTNVTVTNCHTVLHLNLIIEGYYSGSRYMQPALYNEGVSGATSSVADTITVELHNTTNTQTVVESQKAVLMTNGSATATFSGAITDSTYWIAIFQRNTIQTYSAAPVTFNPINTYDFTSTQTSAYGNNLTLVDVGPDLWAIFSGDVNQDGNIDLIDFPPLDFGINNGLFGYYNTDLNGDGNVDLLDFPVLDTNINAGVFAHIP